MKKYIYEAVALEFNTFLGRTKEDYFELINKRGEEGWRFVNFVPAFARYKKVKGLELIFEKEIEDLGGSV